MLFTRVSSPSIRAATLADEVQSLTEHFRQLWWQSQRSLPDLGPAYDARTQASKEREFNRLIDGLVVELKHLSPEPGTRQALQNRLRAHGVSLARDALRLEDRHLDFIEHCGLLDATQEFARMARGFDPEISGEDIYQAGRNVMTMNFLQLLMGLPVKVTPSVFAYSMLYPYTDNYLDDPAMSVKTKRAFNERFEARLGGGAPVLVNRHEEMIGNLVGMIEGEFERSKHPLVWESLLAIHAAQVRSLRLVAPGASPFEQDVVGITFEKGGTSVLADGYLVAGWLSQEEAAFCYGYGCFTQLMDDLEDVQSDQKEGRLTIYAQTAGRWPLDLITNQTIHFGRNLNHLISAFDSPACQPFKELIERSLDPVMIDIIGRAERYYSREYVREVERHTPFRFAATRKVRQKLERKRVSLGRLVDLML